MALPVEKAETVTYAVPLLRYYTAETVRLDREGYECLKWHMKRNIGRAILFLDRESVERFVEDWKQAVGFFEKAGAIDAEYARKERESAQTYPMMAVGRSVGLVMNGVRQALQSDGFWDFLDTFSRGALGYGFYRAARRRQGRGGR